jgi:hypothetical protein
MKYTMTILHFIREHKFIVVQLFFNLHVIMYLYLMTSILKKIFYYQEKKLEYLQLKLKKNKKNNKRIHEK